FKKLCSPFVFLKLHSRRVSQEARRLPGKHAANLNSRRASWETRRLFKMARDFPGSFSSCEIGERLPGKHLGFSNSTGVSWEARRLFKFAAANLNWRGVSQETLLHRTIEKI